MTDHSGILIVRDDGVIPIPDGVPVVRGLVDAVERLVNSLGIPTRDERQQQGPTQDPDRG